MSENYIGEPSLNRKQRRLLKKTNSIEKIKENKSSSQTKIEKINDNMKKNNLLNKPDKTIGTKKS